MALHANVTAITNNYDYYEIPLPKEDVLQEVLDGLKNQSQKNLSPKFFYNQRGSELFDNITRLPEYYQTRTELQILRDNADAIGRYLTPQTTLIEYGSGNTEKLRALLEISVPQVYVPVEISSNHLQKFSRNLATDHPDMHIYAIRADYSQQWDLPDDIPGQHRLGYFAGSSLGNFDRQESVRFLKQVRRHVGPEGGLLIGIDNKKDHDILHRAYNDTQGVTAAFNLNCLEHLNHLIDTNFKPEQFEHHAFYNDREGRIEMHLRSREQHHVCVGDTTIEIDKEETIHTENSYKFSRDDVAALAADAGFSIREHWQDQHSLFSVFYLV